MHLLFIACVLLFAAFTPFNVVLLLIAVFVLGMLCGYFFRAAIGRDLSQFQIAALIKHLDAYAESTIASGKSELSKLSADLKKLV